MMPWFTDHGPSHSKELIRYFGDIFFSSNFSISFSVEELFVIMSSAYLHDLGMQDLKYEGITLENLTDQDYEIIRKRHAERSSEIILDKKIGNSNFKKESYSLLCNGLRQEYYEILSLVCYGHVTDNYYEAQKMCAERSYEIPGAHVRLDLMISMLLFLDELHIHRQRQANEKFSLFNANAYSLFHHYLHYYLRSLEVKYPSIHIVYEFPSNFTPYSGRFVEIIEGKLKRQIDMVSSTFGKYGIVFDRYVHSKTQINDFLELPDNLVLKEFVPIPKNEKKHNKNEYNARYADDTKFELNKIYKRFQLKNEIYTKISLEFAPKKIDQVKNNLSLKYIETNRNKILNVPEDVAIKDYYVWDRYNTHLDIFDDGKSLFLPKPEGNFLQQFKSIGSKLGFSTNESSILNSPEFWIANDIRKPNQWATIVHGDVGVGKSTTIRFVLEEIRPRLRYQGFVRLHVDPFISFGGTHRITEVSPLDLEKQLIAQIRRLVLQDFESVKVSCFRQLCTNENLRKKMPDIFTQLCEPVSGLYGNGEEFSHELKRRLEKERTLIEDFHYNLGKLIFLKYIAESGESKFMRYAHPILIIDNIDRTSHDTQKAAVKIAKKVSATLKSNVLVALRNRRLHKLSNIFADEFDQFAWVRFVPISPPRIAKVFKVRINNYVPMPPQNDSFILLKKKINPNKAIHEVINKFIDLLLMDKVNKSVGINSTGSKAENALLCLYNGNVRRSLATIIDLLNSAENALPIVRLVSELIDILPEYIPPIYERLPFDTFLELIALSGKRLYVRDESLIENLFCCKKPDYHFSNNLVKLRILKYVAKKSGNGSEPVSMESIFKFFLDILNYKRELISAAVDQLLAPPRNILWSRVGTALRHGVRDVEIRDSGLFYLNLRNYIWYLCLIKEDTYAPIDLIKMIGFKNFNKMKNKKGRDFYYRSWIQTLYFLEYLVFAEMNELVEIKARLGNKGLRFLKGELGDSSMFEESLSRIRRYISSKKKKDHVIRSLGREKASRFRYLKGRITNIENKIINSKKIIRENRDNP